MESALMMAPSSRCASSSASADLPLAVGPAISTARFDVGSVAMSLVATLISNPAAAALNAATIERARGALPKASAPIWLDPGIAADIPFTGDAANPQGQFVRALADRVRAALAGAPIDVVVQPASG